VTFVTSALRFICANTVSRTLNCACVPRMPRAQLLTPASPVLLAAAIRISGQLHVNGAATAHPRVTAPLPVTLLVTCGLPL
jgi:hypothetical protein